MRKLSIIVFLIFVIISGCVTSNPMVSMVKAVSLTDYRMFEVPPDSAKEEQANSTVGLRRLELCQTNIIKLSGQ